MAQVDVMIEAEAWDGCLSDAETHARDAVMAALACAGIGDGLVEIAVVLTDDAAIAALNQQYRGKMGPTNVLSFQACTAQDLIRLNHGAGAPVLLGDIVLAYQTIVGEARAQAKTIADHCCHLIVHGTLHLLGHDHGHAAEAEVMEALERAALARIGIADPYESPYDQPHSNRRAIET
ncbi:MAG: rRNA maturation RNase YbeY [Sphingomonadales bacterium]